MTNKPYPHLFGPQQFGRLRLRNRIIAPQHAALLGSLLGTESEPDRYIAYWQAAARCGTGCVVALNGFQENHLPPGFDPTGIDALRPAI